MQFVRSDYGHLVAMLEPIVNVKAKEDLACCLVSIAQKLNFARDFLVDIIMAEVDGQGPLKNLYLTLYDLGVVGQIKNRAAA